MRRGDGRWGAPHSLSFQIMEEEEVSLLIQGLDSHIDQYAGHTSQEGESTVFTAANPHFLYLTTTLMVPSQH